MGHKVVLGQNQRVSLVRAPSKSRDMRAKEKLDMYPMDEVTPAAHPVPDPSADVAEEYGVSDVPATGCLGMRTPHARMTDACARRDWRAVMALTKRHGSKVLGVRVGDDGWSPLHLAAVLNESEALRLMISKGGNPNDVDFDRQTPLHAAVNATIASQLTNAGAQVDARDRSGFTPLHVAAADGYADIVELLLALGADVDARDTNGRTPLHEASTGGHFDVAEKLFACGAHVDPRDEAMGWTPLHLATQHEYVHVMSLLISKGADVNAWDSSGYTALHMAALGESPAVAKVLFEANVLTDLRNANGQSAIDIVRERDIPAMVKVFSDRGKSGTPK